jgi:antitoxin YefM
MLMATKELTITEARKRLMDLPDSKSPSVIKVTRHGRAALAILPWDEYESIVETLEVLGDPELMAALRESIADIQHGNVYSHDEARARLLG